MRAQADAETSAAIFVDFEKLVETIEHVPDALVQIRATSCLLDLLELFLLKGVDEDV